MRLVVQRVQDARVEVGGKTVAVIGQGLLVLAGFEPDDGEEDIDYVAGKLVRLRIFDDDEGVMNRNVQETGGDILAVSQFTLFASVRKGNRPSWSRAARGEISEPLFRQFVTKLEQRLGKKVPSGVFGAHMRVSLCNDGPVTLFIDSRRTE